jgi:hypothetical protein
MSGRLGSDVRARRGELRVEVGVTFEAASLEAGVASSERVVVSLDGRSIFSAMKYFPTQ